jgi:hypothetical protein
VKLSPHLAFHVRPHLALLLRARVEHAKRSIGRVLRLLSHGNVVLFVLGEASLLLRGVLLVRLTKGWRNPGRLADESDKLRDLAFDSGQDLNTGRSVTDQADHLAAEIEVFRPGG